MRIKTIVIIVATVLLTIIIMENKEKVPFTIFWMDFRISKLLVLLIVAIVAFIIGYLAGRPKRRFNLSGTAAGADHPDGNTGTLSEEDRDYIN